MMLREWRNDAETVRFSGTSRRVAPSQHARWVAARLIDPTTRLLIAEQDGVPVGQVRIDVTAANGVVSLAVAPEARGRGVAQAMLRATLDDLTHEGDPSTLTALVHPDNAASIRVFERVGFEPQGATENGFLILKWRPKA
jgi:RimJ/RimL family protein N-acetyltransferase